MAWYNFLISRSSDRSEVEETEAERIRELRRLDTGIANLLRSKEEDRNAHLQQIKTLIAALKRLPLPTITDAAREHHAKGRFTTLHESMSISEGYSANLNMIERDVKLFLAADTPQDRIGDYQLAVRDARRVIARMIQDEAQLLEFERKAQRAGLALQHA